MHSMSSQQYVWHIDIRNVVVNSLKFTLTAKFGCLILISFLLAACQTKPKPETEHFVTTGQLLPFTPATLQAHMQLASGRYPNLYASESRAQWLSPDVLQGADTEYKDLLTPLHDPDDISGEPLPYFGPEFIVIQCRLVSLFSDMSIGYDVVGLRGIQTRMLMPDGRMVAPVHTIIGSKLGEEPAGALLKFSRINYLVFPRGALYLAAPPVGSAGPPIRLLLEGYDSTFYFEWQPTLPEILPDPRFSQQESVQQVRHNYRQAKGKLMEWSHTFD